MSSNQNLPDDLMNHFQGHSLKKIVIFTILVHFVVILVTSIPFLLGKFKDPNEGLSEEQRTQNAIKEANETIAKIAKDHGLQTAQLRSKMSGGRRPSPKPADKPKPDQPAPNEGEGDGTTPPEGEIRGDSDIEQKLQQKLPPPTLPDVNNTDDLFK